MRCAILTASPYSYGALCKVIAKTRRTIPTEREDWPLKVRDLTAVNISIDQRTKHRLTVQDGAECFRRGCTAGPLDTFPVASLLRFRRINVSKPNARPGHIDSVSIDHGRIAYDDLCACGH